MTLAWLGTAESDRLELDDLSFYLRRRALAAARHEREAVDGAAARRSLHMACDSDGATAEPAGFDSSPAPDGLSLRAIRRIRRTCPRSSLR